MMPCAISFRAARQPGFHGSEWGIITLPCSMAGFVFVVHENFRRSSTMAETKVRCHCSIPLGTSSKQRQPHLSFHRFPTELSLRQKWIQAVRRDEGPNFKMKQGSTFVCSRYYTELCEPPESVTPGGGRCCIFCAVCTSLKRRRQA